MTDFKTLQDAHLKLLARQDAAPNVPDLVGETQAYIDQVITGSTYVADPGERDLLRAYLRYWAGVIYQHTGVYPKTDLRPAEVIGSVSSARPTGEGSGATGTEDTPTISRGASGWLWPLLGLLALLLLGATAFLLLGRPTSGVVDPGDTANPDVAQPATPLPAISRTPLPQTPVPPTTIDRSNATQVQALEQTAANSGGALAVAFDPARPEVATGGADGSVRFWVLPDLTLSRQINLGFRVLTVGYSPYSGRGNTSPLFLVGGNDPALNVYNLESLQLFARFAPAAANSGFVFGAQFSPDSSLIASGHGDGVGRLWDVANGTENQTVETGAVSDRLAQIPSGGAAVRDLSFATDGAALALAVTGTEIGVQVTDRTYSNVVCAFQSGAAAAVAFSPRGDVLAAGTESGSLLLLSTSRCQLIYSVQAHEGGVTDVAFSPSGEWLVTSGRDGTMKIWSPTGEQLATLTVGAIPEAVAVAPDSGYIASVDSEGRLILWGIPR